MEVREARGIRGVRVSLGVVGGAMVIFILVLSFSHICLGGKIMRTDVGPATGGSMVFKRSTARGGNFSSAARRVFRRIWRRAHQVKGCAGPSASEIKSGGMERPGREGG